MLSGCDGTDSPETSTKESNSIKAIDRDAVHRICSGQVVLNIATAVKELVENSLDAGATSIEIRFKEHGSELIEVADNGSGVEEKNFEGLTLKHHTSKLREFSDLLGVETYGFRGEALSSLCALSEMTIITRHSSSSLGTKLSFDSKGLITSKTPCARQVGTTVSLLNLFSSLPVRQKEFLRNLKREFGKMTQLLYAYCLISRGVKILCSNQSKKGQKTVIVSTQGSSTFKGNITCIFGAKQAGSLLDFEQRDPDVQHLEEVGLSDSAAAGSFVLEGCISSCAHGQGRSAPDRQFYFINNRPCDPSKVAKVVNEVYHQFNVHQFPFVFMNIKTERSGVDVNVTPDKRQIFLEYEKLLLASVKATILGLFESIPNTYQLQNVLSPVKSKVNSFPSEMASKAPSLGRLSSMLKTFTHSSTRNSVDGSDSSNSELQSFKVGRGVKRALECNKYDRDGKKQLSLSSFISSKREKQISTNMEKDYHSEVEILSIKRSETIEDCDMNEDNYSIKDFRYDSPQKSSLENVMSEVSSKESSKLKSSNILGDKEKRSDMNYANSDNTFQSVVEKDTNMQKTFPCTMKLNLKSKSEETVLQDMLNSNKNYGALASNDSQKVKETLNSENDHVDGGLLLTDIMDGEAQSSLRKVVYINVTLDLIQQKWEKSQEVDSAEDYSSKSGHNPKIRFYSKIDPTNNKCAEKELQTVISKDMFAKMVIVGQFNLGFIITKLGSDLFIVDQHATDEKYNFEMLQMHTTLQNQKLVIPQVLDLTPSNESLLMENLDIFLKNGFSFVIDKEAEASKRIKLAAKPISHNWEFGKEDIDELLFMLQDSPHTMCRPSRVRAMFASRACRKSVMIGTALSKSVMQQLISHMGEIEQPWNCPHGRPTMRHLINLELIQKRR